MRDLTQEELKRVGGGKTDWDAYNRNHGITRPINNGYGNMPNPPNFNDFSTNVKDGMIVGAFIGGPVGAIEGGILNGSYYLIKIGYSNISNYYF